MADPADIAAKLRVLSDAYAAQLPQKFTELEAAWARVPIAGWNEEIFQGFYRQVHSMTGSGKTFGFSALSDVARGLENFLKELMAGKVAPNVEQRKQIQVQLAELRQVGFDRDAEATVRTDLMAAPSVDTGKISRRIVIVCNDAAYSANLQNQLNYFGYEVAVYNRLEDIKRGIAQSPRSVVVMDISFPEDELGGIHAMQEIQQGREYPIPVVFIADQDAFEARLAAVRAGGAAYFNKTPNVSALIDRLDELTSPPQQAPCRVMIVDDSVSLTAYYAAVLEQAGMRVMSINDPLLALQPLLEFSPDLILIDMYMPGCNGMELARVIRQLEAFVSIPIVFLSAEQDIDKQLLAMNLGVDDFLTKPIQPQHLVASVNSRLRRSLILRSFMVRDSLTGLLNHSAIKEQLDREVARARRQKTAFSFAMVDIDFFKRVNDTHGHPAGDRVIKSLSRLLRQRLRENDAVGRYGGEEFAVILMDAEGAAAEQVLNVLREDFSRLRHVADGVEFSATFSCGVADVTDFDDPVSLCDAADRALYQAKHGGRNRVVRATNDVSQQQANI